MDSIQLTAADQQFRDAAILLFAKQCLKQRGLEGAIGCGSLARDFADDLLAKRNEQVKP